MQSQLQAAINQICAEKNINKAFVINAIEEALAISYKKDFGTPGLRIKVMLGDDIAETRIYEMRDVVEKVEDFELDITAKDAQRIRPDASIGDTVYVPIEVHENFGRIAAQTAKQVIGQKIQEAERSMLFDKFKEREGELLTARVQKSDPNAVLLEIEGVSTMLFRRQQIPNEQYFTGKRLQVLLEKVESTGKGPQLRVTRSSDQFIVKLFEREIPEMREGIVYVAKIAREAGVRSKIAVASYDNSVDPVGAFVGQRGSRINVVMEEVGEERLDIIQFSENQKKFLLSALSPAKVSKVEFYEGKSKEARVKIFVREEERAVTIGRRGQNVRVAGQLLGLQIDVNTFDGPPEEDESLQINKPEPRKTKKRKIRDDLTIDALENVDKDVIELLKEMGLSQVKQFEGLKPEELAEVGITLEQATSVINAVQNYIG